MKLCADCKGERGELESERAIYCPVCLKDRKSQRRRYEARKSLLRKTNRTVEAAIKRQETEAARQAEDRRAIEVYRAQREYERARGLAGDPGRSLSREEINRLVAENRITDPRHIRSGFLVERVY